MKGNNKDGINAKLLRQKAEEYLKSKQSKGTLPLGETAMLKLLHELDVQQVELEMQNEELKLAVEKAETATALYDFGPSGYFTIDANATISELNHSGANLLKKEHSSLINKDFRLFISPENLPVFNNFLDKVFETDTKQACEISFSIHGNPLLFVHLEGIVSENSNKCILVAVDITERKKTEEALRKSEAENRAISEVNPDILFRINKQGFILDYHAPAHTQFYVPPEFFLGKSSGFSGIIQDSSERAMDLLVNLLEWSRSQTGRMEFLPEEIDFCQLVRNVTRLLNDSAKNKGISIYTELPDRLIVFADKAMLGTILQLEHKTRKEPDWDSFYAKNLLINMAVKSG